MEFHFDEVFIIRDELRRLTLSDSDKVFEKLELIQPDEEKFKILYHAAVRSNAPVRKLLSCFQPLFSNDFGAILINLAKEGDPHDVLLQISLAAKFFFMYNDSCMVELIIERLEKLCLWGNREFMRRIRKALAICTKEKLQDVCARIKVNCGMIVLLGCCNIGDFKLEDISKWFSDNAIQLESMPMVLGSIRLILSNTSTRNIESTLLPVFNRLLLRSTLGTLGLLKEIGNFGHDENLLDSLGDSFWCQFTSENDENRIKAHEIVLLKVSDPSYYMKKFEMVYAGKSFKVKRAILMTLFKLVKNLDGTEKVIEDTLKSLLSKEVNIELIYWMLSSLVLVNPDGVWSEMVKETKPATKSAYLAALSLSQLKKSDLLPQMIEKKDITPLDHLLAIICWAETGNLKSDSTYLELKPGRFLTEKNVIDALEKYPALPIYKCVNLFDLIGDNTEGSRVIWKTLVNTNLNSEQQATHLIKYVAKLGKVSAVCLATVCRDLASTISSTVAIRLGKLSKATVRIQADLLEFLTFSDSGIFGEIKLWSILTRGLKLLGDPVSGDEVLKRILPLNDPKIISYAISSFPQLIPSFCAFSIKQLHIISNINLNEEDLAILNTSDEKLPIIDGTVVFIILIIIVVTPIRKAQEIAARKDMIKKLGNPTIIKNTTSMSKNEKLAFEAELQRERCIKADLIGFKMSLKQLTFIAKVITELKPASIEPLLGEVSSFITKLLSSKWIDKEFVQFLYFVASCCHQPLGRYGPLLITCILVLNGNDELIDIDWNIRDSKEITESLFHHLGDSTTSKSTFLFMLPTLLMILNKSKDIELKESHASLLLNILGLNSKSYLSTGQLVDCLNALANLLKYLPGMIVKVITCAEQLVKLLEDTSIDTQFCVPLITNASQFVRKLGLCILLCMIKQIPDLIIDAIVKLWISIMEHDSFCAPIASELITSLEINPKATIKWIDILEVILNDSLDNQITEIAIKALCNCLIEPTAYLHLSLRYKELFETRTPEITDIRSKEIDLTKIARIRLSRIYVALANAAKFDEFKIGEILNFFLEYALFDPCEEIQSNLLNAVDYMIMCLESRVSIDSIVEVCDNLLSHKSLNSDEASDRVRIYAVIILSKLTSRLSKNDARRISHLSSLYNALSTPSENVQNAVADAMVPLFASTDRECIYEYVDKFLNGMINGKSMAIRRGSAYGLGAMVKGFGSPLLKQCDIIIRLVNVQRDKNATMEGKQGALFGLELLSHYLGKHFEPYIIKLVDTLIITFADGRAEIREATADAANAIIRNVSTLGSQLILPILLSLMNTNSWRSKVGAFEWLGAMANLAPRILSKQLPTILPKVLDGLNDSHHAVQKAAHDALRRYVNVVRNPEIKSLSPLIMDTLSNPPQLTEKCLDAILHTAFAHVIDGPSMALLEPIIVRALRDRTIGGTECKKKAAQILGNLATNLIDPRDLSMFLEGIVPSLVSCLSDPIPEVRSSCGKVLGILAQTVGESALAMRGLMAELLNIIGSPFATSVDRAGAAQALAEIFAARGPHATSKTLQTQILNSLNNTKANMREGYVMLIGFLPAAFDTRGTLGELYEDGMRDLLGLVIGLLADDNEAVREAATISCKQVISRIARIDRIAIFDVLLETLSDSRWRCRLGCLQLFQEFLSKFASGDSDTTIGIFAIPTIEELAEGGIDAERVKSLMTKAFLYRFDGNSSTIRHIALTIWKGLASHPLRSLSQIVPILLEDCCLMMINDMENREIVSKVLEDVLEKVGDRIIIAFLDHIKELFEAGYEVASLFIASHTAKMVGAASFPIITSSTNEQVVNKLIDLVQLGLYSANISTRTQACYLFRKICDTCTKIGIIRSIDKILKPMLDELTGDPIVDPVTLDGLSSLLEADESCEVLKLTLDRISRVWKEISDAENAFALCSITSTIFDRVGASGAFKSVQILQSIVSSKFYSVIPESLLEGAIKSILASLESEKDSPYQVSLSQLIETLYSESCAEIAFRIIRIYCTIDGADLSRFYNVWSIRLFSDLVSSEEAKRTAASLLEAVQVEHLITLANAFYSGLQRIDCLDVTCKQVISILVKNIIVPMLLQSNSLVVNDEEWNTVACQLSRALARKVTVSAWSSSLTSLVGALIRAASDRKTTSPAVFETLTCCVVSHLTLIKPFYPQLQRIYLNALILGVGHESAVEALVALIPVLSRPEQIINELLNMAGTEGDDGRIAALTVLGKIQLVVEPEKCVEVARICMSENDANVRDTAAVWIEKLKDTPQMYQYRSLLLSLLDLK